jgi:hypothetical protein
MSKALQQVVDARFATEGSLYRVQCCVPVVLIHCLFAVCLPIHPYSDDGQVRVNPFWRDDAALDSRP